MFGVPLQVLFGQLLLGLINGSFYALLSLGLAVIFGMLNVINFAHGAFYMVGAFVAWMLLAYFGIDYWWSLVIVPIVVGALGAVLERLMISRLYRLDHLYGLLLTFGLALVIAGCTAEPRAASSGPVTSAQRLVTTSLTPPAALVSERRLSPILPEPAIVV